jgi:hypothetical protein
MFAPPPCSPEGGARRCCGGEAVSHRGRGVRRFAGGCSPQSATAFAFASGSLTRLHVEPRLCGGSAEEGVPWSRQGYGRNYHALGCARLCGSMPVPVAPERAAFVASSRHPFCSVAAGCSCLQREQRAREASEASAGVSGRQRATASRESTTSTSALAGEQRGSNGSSGAATQRAGRAGACSSVAWAAWRVPCPG